MARVINGTLFVPSYNSLGSGVYTITDATYTNVADATGNGAYDLQNGFILYTPAADPNTFLPVTGVCHKYSISSLTIVNSNTINCTITWAENGPEVDTPLSGATAMISENDGGLGIGYAVSQEVYPDLGSGIDLGATVVEDRNSINPTPVTIAHGGTGATSLGGSGALVMNSAGTAVTSVLGASGGQVLRWSGTAWLATALASTDLSDGGTLIKTSTSLSGDLSGSLPSPTVAKVNGVAVSGTPSSGQVLTATSGTAASWQTPTGGAPSGAAGGDLSGSYPNPTVAAIQGMAVSATQPNVAGQVLIWDDGNSGIWGPGLLESSQLFDGSSLIKTTTTLGGDLSGNLPSPTVAKVNGVSVSGTPSSGQVITATGSSTASWQNPSASGGGYATVVVAAPTGTASTDTTNIQNAINTLTSGGTVVLREGTYVVGTTLTMKAGVLVIGQGSGQNNSTSITAPQGSTTIQCGTGLGNNSLINDNGSPVSNIGFQDLAFDFNAANRVSQSGQSAVDLYLTGSYVYMNNVVLGNTCGNNPAIKIQPVDATSLEKNSFKNCSFLHNGANIDGTWMTIYGRVTDCYIEGSVTGGIPETLVNGDAIFTGCVIATAVSYSTAILQNVTIVTGCLFRPIFGTSVTNSRAVYGGNGTVTGNYCTSTNQGQINMSGPVTGNQGFSSYTGGATAANL